MKQLLGVAPRKSFGDEEDEGEEEEQNEETQPPTSLHRFPQRAHRPGREVVLSSFTLTERRRRRVRNFTRRRCHVGSSAAA